MADLNDVMRALGRLEGSVTALREEFVQEKQSAAESRRILYQRVDDLSDEVGQVKLDVQANGQEVKALGENIAQHKAKIDPAIADWTRMKNLGLGVSGVIGLGGASFGAIAMMGWDYVKDTLRTWLG